MSTSAAAAPPAVAEIPQLNRLPRATYRLQLRSGFGFDEVAELVDYLASLGISDLYLSPLFRAREESEHGYDVVDHAQVEPAFGDLQSFRRLAERARVRGMGIVLDIVPNHMGINDPANVLWNDVLENGPAARSAIFFDIDWDPPGSERSPRVLLPFLGRSLGDALEAGELQVRYEEDRFLLAYFEREFPLAPPTWPPLLRAALERLPEQTAIEHREELQSIVTHLERLPPTSATDEDATLERYREQSVIRRRLAAVVAESEEVRGAIEAGLAVLNGDPSDPRSFDALEDLLKHQHYRLAYWRVAVDEINYRRFFDISDLAAIRVEEPAVFENVHQLTFQLLAEGLVTGLRIDHPDGLLDPMEYFKNLQSTFRRLNADRGESRGSLYVVAEKILSGSEPLPTEWPISGTTGYEFLNQLSAVLVDPSGVQRLQQLYGQLTGVTGRPRDIAYEGKRTILHEAMASELFVLASRLLRLARANRSTVDFTLPVLLRALREVIACFPVYRTYTPPHGWEVSSADHGRIMDAVRWAKRRNPTMPWSAFDYIAAVLLLEFPKYLSSDLQAQWRQWALKFQQVTGPVTAKGIEDTAFYRYYPLASLNEVGAELGSDGCEPEEFHRVMLHRRDDWPAAMSATATHDTKRGEDVRTRLHVLSEMPEVYAEEFQRWDQATAELRTEVDGEAVPEPNARYFIHQTLLGTWPLETSPQEASTDSLWEEYEQRMLGYFEKAFREAKINTSWFNPSDSYEQAIQAFVRGILQQREAPPFALLDQLARRMAGPGFVNSLSQLVLKATLPGVPDFYQGSEYWNFRLVDPDNRRPVDYAARGAQLSDLQRQYDSNASALVQRLGESWDDALKMLVTARLLEGRRVHPELFAAGDYQALELEGERARHALAFLRRWNDQWTLVVVARLPLGLVDGQAMDGGESKITPPSAFAGDCWGDTVVLLPENAPRRWADTISGGVHDVDGDRVRVQDLFQHLCVAVLFSDARN